ncbi:oligosaccharide flippase family protein [Alkalimarinus coralli]|uniref:oligosaccharide flippase family protein n=1 Tax=Alkalimarinus coralli TaxID=2935863 RepID=UPI00202AC7F9|nr:oligosaccharide flippase family protein [Alkalimarinus coralli]
MGESTKVKAKEGNRGRLLRLMSQSLATKLIMLTVRLLRNAILARVLGPVERGAFALIMTLPEMISTMGNMGASSSVAYYASQREPRLPAIGGFITLICFAGGGALGLIAYGVITSQWFSANYGVMILSFVGVITVMVPLYLFRINSQSFFVARDSIGKANVLRLTESLGPLVLFLVFWLVLDIAPLLAAVYAWLISFVLILIAAISWYKKEGALPPRFHLPTFKAMISYGARGHFDALFQTMLLRIDFLFIGAMLGSEELGYYAMASAAAELLLMFPEAIAFPLMSRLMRSHEQPRDKLTPLALRFIFTSMLCAAVMLAIVGDWLIILLFGRDYLPAYEPMLLLLPGLICLSICGVLRLDLLGRNKPGLVSIIAGMAVLMNLLLNWTLIPLWGNAGAAVSSSISYFFAASLLHTLYTRYSGVSPLHTLLVRKSDIETILSIVKPASR